MIDYEIDVFDKLARGVLAVSPGAYVSSQHVSAPPQFPAVSIVEASNIEAEGTIDSADEEKYCAVTYELNVYSASRSDPKGECRSIAQAVDRIMRALCFKRAFFGPVDNAADPSIYRIAARYTGVIDRHGVFYGR